MLLPSEKYTDRRARIFIKDIFRAYAAWPHSKNAGLSPGRYNAAFDMQHFRDAHLYSFIYYRVLLYLLLSYNARYFI